MSLQLARPRRTGIVLLLAGATSALVGATLAPAAFAGTTSKPAYVNVTPGTVGPGSRTEFTVTITNGTTTQQLGSADVTPPPGFTNVSATTDHGTVNATGSPVQLRTLNLAPGQTETAKITATAPCSAVAADWTFVVKQSNNFNGPPGNNFFVVASPNLTTTVTGSCHLAFTTQPNDATAGTTITGDDHGALKTPPSTDHVAVSVLDDADNPVTTASATISVAIGDNTGGGTLSGTLEQPTVDGVATFDDISIDQPGLDYTLTASATGFSNVTSTAFDIDLSTTLCDPSQSTCVSPTVTSDGTDKTKGQVTGLEPDEGSYISISFSVVNIDCDGYDEPGDSTMTFDYTGAGAKIAVLTIDKRVVNAAPNNGVSFFELCYGSPNAFTTKAGFAQTTQGDLYVGVLPDCSSKSPSVTEMPCVISKTKDKAGNVTITFAAPPGDPHAR